MSNQSQVELLISNSIRKSIDFLTKMINKKNIFISQSHSNQKISYGISEWLYWLWPNVYIHLTHRGLTLWEALRKNSYLSTIQNSQVVINLLSKESMTSNAVFDELKVALESQIPIIQIYYPNMDSEDHKVYSYLKEFWEPKYGQVIQINEKGGEFKFLNILKQTISGSYPGPWYPGSLKIFINKERNIPEDKYLPIPNIEKVVSGKGTIKDTIQWLSLLEQEQDHLLCSFGRPIPNRDDPYIINRIRLYLKYVLQDSWPEILKQLRPLVNSELLDWIKYYQT